jgi:hypothetical protein
MALHSQRQGSPITGLEPENLKLKYEEMFILVKLKEVSWCHGGIVDIL